MFNLIQKETGIVIDSFDSYDEAKKQIDFYEMHDKNDGCYTKDFYAIIKKGDTND